jgi:hypothetical protein
MNRTLRPFAVALTLSLAAGAPGRAFAQSGVAPVDEARQHYRRGVELFGESNFSAALVEFRRAYELAPNFSVLYNIAQIHFQQHDYAEALKTFTAYLNEGGNKVPPARRTEVENELKFLRERVGYVEIVSNVEGADVSVDGVSTGKTPFSAPLVVSAGRRRIELLREDRVLATRQIEVAAGDRIKLELNVAPSAPAASADAAKDQGGDASRPGDASADAGEAKRGALPAVMWTATGVLAVGTAVVGVLSLGAASDLKTKRETEGSTRDDLDNAQSKAKTMALVTDILGATTIVCAGVAAYVTFAPRSKAASTTDVQVKVGGNGVYLTGRF